MFDLGEALKNVSIPDTGREQIVYLSLDKLDSDENNFYQLTDIEGLAANIATCGLQQPIRVRANAGTDRYIIVSGHRRRAALSELAKENPGKWGEVPCIIEQDDVSPALQQLRLIYANAHTRKLTPSEISEQAVQVEKLLYQLKEEGHEFPGRMRDHVAQAVGTSKTKLARLKVIRDSLASVWLGPFRAGKLLETPAYSLAQLPKEWQRILYEGYGRDYGGTISEATIENYRKHFQEISNIQCSIDKLPESSKGPCSHRSIMMEKTMKVPYIWDACKCCCLECDKLTRCGHYCFHAGEKRSADRAARKQEIQQEKDAAKEKECRDEALIATTYDRVKMARDEKGISAKALLLAANMHPSLDGMYEKRETGREIITHKTGLAYMNQVTLDAARQLIALADTLGCSIDYLLGRDENLKPATEPVTVPGGWQTGDPPKPGEYAVLTQSYAGGSFFTDDRMWDGCEWITPGYSDDPVVYWMPYPEEL